MQGPKREVSNYPNPLFTTFFSKFTKKIRKALAHSNIYRTFAALLRKHASFGCTRREIVNKFTFRSLAQTLQRF